MDFIFWFESQEATATYCQLDMSVVFSFAKKRVKNPPKLTFSMRTWFLSQFCMKPSFVFIHTYCLRIPHGSVSSIVSLWFSLIKSEIIKVANKPHLVPRKPEECPNTIHVWTVDYDHPIYTLIVYRSIIPSRWTCNIQFVNGCFIGLMNPFGYIGTSLEITKHPSIYPN